MSRRRHPTPCHSGEVAARSKRRVSWRDRAAWFGLINGRREFPATLLALHERLSGDQPVNKDQRGRDQNRADGPKYDKAGPEFLQPFGKQFHPEYDFAQSSNDPEGHQYEEGEKPEDNIPVLAPSDQAGGASEFTAVAIRTIGLTHKVCTRSVVVMLPNESAGSGPNGRFIGELWYETLSNPCSMLVQSASL